MGVEVCQLVFVTERPKNEKCWWEARQSKSQGMEVICKSPEYVDAHGETVHTLIGALMDIFRSDEKRQELMNRSKDQKQASHAYVVAQLTEEGWEPAGTNEEGLVTVMKRTRHEPS